MTPRPNRVRKPRNLTLNPGGIEKLVQVGAAQAVPESNLSRLVDAAIADYVRRHWRAEMAAGPAAVASPPPAGGVVRRKGKSR
ncbi:MAG: hypothetical protein JWO31_1509 [Phycisphaerales bacterium]|nr:hypothetical protein [Phycisphaerales bacterium]